MHSLFFTNEYLLQSVGWAIINSFWQVGLLWAIYQFVITLNTKSSPVFKHNLSVVFLLASFTWFIFTITKTYILLNEPKLVSTAFFNSFGFNGFGQFDKILPSLSVIYIALLFIYSIKFISGYQQTIVLQKNNLLKPPFGLRMFSKNIAIHIGIKKKVEIWLSEYIDVPSVIGFFKPVILLPVAVINHLSTDQLEAILLHELAHIKRNDYVINLLQSMIETILFFNPFVILLSRYAKQERENCCDDWVMNYQYSKHQYASALLLLEEQRRQHLVLAIAATNKKEFLFKRIKRLFNYEQQTTINIFQKIQIIAISFILFLGMAGLFLFPSANHTAEKSKHTPSVVKANSFFERHPSIFIYPTSNKEIVTRENNFHSKYNPSAIKNKKTEEKYSVNKKNTDYTLALINADLLKNDKQLTTSITTVADKETNLAREYYIKVEEEQSGKKQMNVYYFELNKDNGKTTIEPIMILKKPIHKKELKKPHKPFSLVTERITS